MKKAIGVFLVMGFVQWWVMVSAIADWTGSTALALIISFSSWVVPLPWFLVGH